jgi:hypothetical protein
MRRWTPVLMHGLVVAFLLAMFAYGVATDTGPDANIGLGILGMSVTALGVPWTAPAFAAPDLYDGLSDQVRYALLLGPAVLNIGIHALIVGRRRSPVQPPQ